MIDRAPGGMSIREIRSGLEMKIEPRTLARRLALLVETNKIVREGRGRATRYQGSGEGDTADTQWSKGARIPLSEAGAEIAEAVGRSLVQRSPVSYRREFLDAYEPNRTSYLPPDTRAELARIGRPGGEPQPVGTYARRILDRLLIDLSFHSSRLEGNTYSLLETQRLIERGRLAHGHDAEESQMILNHKAAIEFLVESVGELAVDRLTILNLHALLAENLLGDPAAEGRLRKGPVAIGGSPYLPNAVPQTIEECFNQLALVASRIADPFEQCFFLLVQIPYLQPFEDANKRVSRLAGNIPLIRGGLSPLSFVDVPREEYTSGLLGVYEFNRVELLRDVFVWSYKRSARRFAAIRDSLGSPDEFRLRFRAEIKEIVGEIIRGVIPPTKFIAFTERWARDRLPPAERARFETVIEAELVGLHEGNFARYRVTPAQFEAWMAADEDRGLP